MEIPVLCPERESKKVFYYVSLSTTIPRECSLNILHNQYFKDSALLWNSRQIKTAIDNNRQLSRQKFVKLA